MNTADPAAHTHTGTPATATDAHAGTVTHMELGDLLDTVHHIGTCAPLGTPTWTHQVNVAGRSYSPRHVVCVGALGHTTCLATGTPRSYTLAELDRRGNGGRRAICDGGHPHDVALTDDQVADLEVLTHLSAALIFDRYHAASVGETDCQYSPEQIHTAIDAARTAAGAHRGRAALCDYVDGLLHVHHLHTAAA